MIMIDIKVKFVVIVAIPNARKVENKKTSTNIKVLLLPMLFANLAAKLKCSKFTPR